MIDKIIKFKVEELTPYVGNAKQHPQSQIDAIKKSIERFGFNDPIAVWGEDNIIVEGHGRLVAAEQLGIDEVPCIRLDHMSEEERRAYTIAHNSTSLNSGFDLEKLNTELASIDFDMAQFGLDEQLKEIEREFEQTRNEKDDEIFYFAQKEIQEDIVREFKKYSNVSEYVKNIMSIAKAKYEFNRLCQGYKAGYNISLLFNPHRLNTETAKNKSIFWAINNSEKYRKEFARYLVTVEKKVPIERDYYKFIGVGHAGYQFVNEFQPYVARDIYKKYCFEGAKILNPCAGWGGRIIGLASCRFKDIEYVEVEPATQTYKGLLELKKFLGLNEKQYKTINDCFENTDLKTNYFDFVFTSPPYFDTERYADEETQSYKNKASYEDWREHFLYIMLDKILLAMKIGAACVLNVGNVRYPIATDIINYLKEKGIRAKYLKDIRLSHQVDTGIGARTNRNNDEDIVGEPFIEFLK